MCVCITLKKRAKPAKLSQALPAQLGVLDSLRPRLWWKVREFVRVDQLFLSRIKNDDQRVHRLWIAQTALIRLYVFWGIFWSLLLFLLIVSSNSQLLKFRLGITCNWGSCHIDLHLICYFLVFSSQPCFRFIPFLNPGYEHYEEHGHILESARALVLSNI